NGAPAQQQKVAQLDQVEAQGIGLVRLDAAWQGVEPNRPDPLTGAHTFVWTGLDNAVTLMAQHQIRWAPIVDYGTTWASPTNDQFSPPLTDTDWSAYAGALA